MDPRIKALHDRANELVAQMNELLGDESKALTAEEGQQFDTLKAEFDAIPAKIQAINDEIAATAARRQAFRAVQSTKLSAGRQSAPQFDASSTTTMTVKSEVMTLDEIRTRFADKPDQKPIVLNAKNGGFQSLGEQLMAIASAESDRGRYEDPRLFYGRTVPQMAITGAGASVPSDGGYLIQKDVMNDLMTKAYGGDEVLSRVRRYGCSSNSDGVTINTVDETSRVNGSRVGGLQVYWGAEADAATASKPKFRQTTWQLKDVIGLLYATDRLLADASILEGMFTDAFSEEIRFFVGNAVINGLGGGQMLGILNSGATVSVAKETGQAAATIVPENINKMWSRMWARSRGNAVWLINQDCEPALDSMAAVVGTGGVPVYLPAGGLSQSRLASLKGAPVIATEFNATLGTTGDIMLVDLSQYLMVDKGGIKSDSSIHVRFINNETTFRFLYRVDGRPLWNSALTPAKGSNTLSPFVKLDTRA